MEICVPLEYIVFYGVIIFGIYCFLWCNYLKIFFLFSIVAYDTLKKYCLKNISNLFGNCFKK